MLCRAASATIRSRWEDMNVPMPACSAPAPRRTSVVKAVSISRSLLTSRTMSCCPTAEAAARSSETKRSVMGHLGPAKKVRHQKRQPVSLIRAVLDRDVLALDEACFLQSLAERSHAAGCERPAGEKPHHRHRWLLRPRRYWPRCRAAERG